MRIFTHATISPSLSLRQRPSRYAIRAGRNLPDKEFRYLRTVIVTAAIHQGFDSRLPPPLKEDTSPPSADAREILFPASRFHNAREILFPASRLRLPSVVG